MQLELGTFPVTDVGFGQRTCWQDGVLEINREQVVRAVRNDPRITRVQLEVARPGDSLRITAMRDIIEPRVKTRGTGTVYPGVCGRSVETVGEGRTHRLSGVSVIEISADQDGRGRYRNSSFIDMSGPGAETVPYGSLLNLCLVMQTDPNLHIEDQSDALHRAALTVSDLLASTTLDLQSPTLDVFELKPVDASLPRVVYITCHNSPQHYANSLTAWGTAIYGLTRQTPPWVLHPNELLDGAICCGDSWRMVNNPVLLELYRRHGTDLNFVGCIAIRTRWSSQAEKDITSRQCAKLARMMGTTGAVVTWDAGGNDFMEVIRTVQACEALGIKTVFLTYEEPTNFGGSPLLEPLPEAKAIVSIGIGTGLRAEVGVPLPPVERVIGIETLVADPNTQTGTISARGPIESTRWVDYYGFGCLSGFSY